MRNVRNTELIGLLEFTPNERGIFSGEHAKKVFNYLMDEVSYRPDEPFYSLLDAIEFGFPKKPRYQLRDGDYAINEYKHSKGFFYDDESMKWIAFDDSSGECFTEEFETDELAKKWLNNDFDVI